LTAMGKALIDDVVKAVSPKPSCKGKPAEK